MELLVLLRVLGAMTVSVLGAVLLDAFFQATELKFQDWKTRIVCRTTRVLIWLAALIGVGYIFLGLLWELIFLTQSLSETLLKAWREGFHEGVLIFLIAIAAGLLIPIHEMLRSRRTSKQAV